MKRCLRCWRRTSSVADAQQRYTIRKIECEVLGLKVQSPPECSSMECCGVGWAKIKDQIQLIGRLSGQFEAIS